MNRGAYGWGSFHRHVEQLRHQVVVLAYCRTHREEPYVTLLCDQISCSHSFQMLRLRLHVVVGDPLLDEWVHLSSVRQLGPHSCRES